MEGDCVVARDRGSAIGWELGHSQSEQSTNRQLRSIVISSSMEAEGTEEQLYLLTLSIVVNSIHPGS